MIFSTLPRLDARPSDAGCPPFYDASWSMPLNLGVCDLTVEAPLTIRQFNESAPGPYTFRIEITYNADHFDLADAGSMTETGRAPDGFGNEVVSGTFTVANPDPANPGFYVETALLRFARLTTWNGNTTVEVEIFDDACPEPLQQEFSSLVDLEKNFFDLRNTPYNTMHDLIVNIPEIAQAQHLNFLIDEDFVIDWSISEIGAPDNRSFFALLPGVRVTVQDNYAALFKYFDVYSCGGQLAEGLVVESGAELILDNADIRDCRRGVDARPGSALTIVASNFANNYIGLNLDMRTAPAGQRRVLLYGLTGNTFQTAAGQSLKQPHAGMPEAAESRGYCGIRLILYEDFNVFSPNTFTRLANGVVASSTTTNLARLTFSDIRSVDNPPAYGIRGNGIFLFSALSGQYWARINEPWLPAMSFHNCQTGVRAVRYAGKVENCTMSAMETGVDWSNSATRDITVRGNTIEASRYGIRSYWNEPTDWASRIGENTITITGPGSGSAPATGISLEEQLGGSLTNLNGLGAMENAITLEDGGRGVFYQNGVFGSIGRNVIRNKKQTFDYQGIRVENLLEGAVAFNTIDQVLQGGGLGNSEGISSAAGVASGVACNCIDKTGVGLQFHDMADLSNLVVGNALNEHATGLQLGDANDGMTVIGDQEHTGNTWELTAIPPGGFGGVHWGASQFVIALSEFFVDEAENPAFNPPVDPDFIWFKNEPDLPLSLGCNDLACSFPLPPLPPRAGESDAPTRLDALTAMDSFPAPVFEAETRWKAAYRLYRKVLRRPALEQIDLYGTFKSAHENTTVGRLAYVAEERGKLFGRSAAQQADLAALRLQAEVAAGQLRALDSLRQLGVAVEEGQYATTLQQRTQHQAAYEQCVTALDDARRQRIVELRLLNGAVTPDLVIDANHKTVNAAVFDLLENDTLDAPTLTALIAVAAQCPLRGGDAVYEARGIVLRWTGLAFDDADVCPPAGERSNPEWIAQQDMAEDHIKLFPNPTPGRLYWTDTSSAPLVAEVYNTLGQLSDRQHPLHNWIDVKHLEPGVYTLRLRAPDGRVLLVSRFHRI